MSLVPVVKWELCCCKWIAFLERDRRHTINATKQASKQASQNGMLFRSWLAKLLSEKLIKKSLIWTVRPIKSILPNQIVESRNYDIQMKPLFGCPHPIFGTLLYNAGRHKNQLLLAYSDQTEHLRGAYKMKQLTAHWRASKCSPTV